MTENDRSSETKFWSIRAAQFIEEMRVAKAYGLFPKKEGWRNVVEHLLVESEVTDVLAESLSLGAQDRKVLRQAALLHDVYKRRQRELIDQKGNAGPIEATKEQDKFLLEKGYQVEVVALTRLVGHISLEQLVANPIAETLELNPSINLMTLIIHYADDVVSDSSIVSLNQRMDILEDKQPPYPEAELGTDIFAGRTFYQVQRIVGHLIEDHLASKIDILSSQLPGYITKRIAERIKRDNGGS